MNISEENVEISICIDNFWKEKVKKLIEKFEGCQIKPQLRTCAQSHGKTVIFMENETVDSFGPHMIELPCHWKPPKWIAHNV